MSVRCLSVCPRYCAKLPNGICTGFKRRYHSVFCQEDLERVLQKRPLSMRGEGFRDPLFEQLFSKINIYKTPCPEGVCRRRYHSVNQPDISDKQTKSIRIVALDLGSPLRGRTALRVQSSKYPSLRALIDYQVSLAIFCRIIIIRSSIKTDCGNAKENKRRRKNQRP